MELRDLAVGLRSVGAGPFVCDLGSSAGVSPGDGASEHAGRGDSFIVGADLNVGDTGVVIEAGVRDRVHRSGAPVHARWPCSVVG